MSTLQRHRIEEKNFRNFCVSIFFHALIAAIFSINFVFFPNQALLIESAVRVDLVGLPEKSQQLPPPLTQSLEKIEEKSSTTTPKTESGLAPDATQKKIKNPPQEAAINLAKTKSRQQQALDKIKALEALEKMKKEISQQQDKKNSPRPVRGNVLSAGTALTGVNQLQYEQYFGQLDLHIKNNWSLPEFLQNRELRTQVKIQFDENGYVLSKIVTLSSGNMEYDNFVLETIQRSSPLPPPPEKFQDIVKHRGVLLGFPE